MKTIAIIPFLALSLAAWAPSCGGNTPTPAPTPPPAPPPLSWDAGPPAPFVPPAPSPTPVPVTPPDNSCGALCAHLAHLKCVEWAVSCDADCARRDANLMKLGSKPSDHSCAALAPTCEAARACK